MFFSSKFKRQGNKKTEYVLEGVSGDPAHFAMSSAIFKFDKESPAALALKAAFWEKLKEIWCAYRSDRTKNVLVGAPILIACILLSDQGSGVQ